MLRRPDHRRKEKRAGKGLRRLARGIGKGILGLLLFVLGVITLALLCINLPFARALISEQVTNQLAPLFRGKISVTAIGWIQLDGVSGVEAIIQDDTSRQVLLVQGVSARIDTLGALASVLSDHGDIELHFKQVNIGSVDVLLDSDPAGDLYLAKAFESRTATTPASTPNDQGRGLHLLFRNVRIEHAWAHGKLQDLPYLDVDLADSGSLVDISEFRLQLVSWHTQLVSRGPIAGLDLDGASSLTLTLPLTEQGVMSLQASYLGKAGQVPLAAIATLEGERLQGKAGLLDVTPEQARNTFPGVKLNAHLNGAIEAQGTLSRLEVEGFFRLGKSRAIVDGSLNFAEPLSAHADVTLKKLDLHAIDAGLPASEINALAELEGSFGDVTTAEFSLTTSPSTVMGVQVERAHAKGQFQDNVFEANGEIVDPKVTATFGAKGCPEGDDWALTAELHADARDLTQLETVVPGLSGKLMLDGKGTVRPKAAQIEALLHAEGQDLHLGSLAAQSLSLRARVSNRLTDPEIEAKADARNITFGEDRIAHARVTVSGKSSAPRVEAQLKGGGRVPDLFAATNVRFGKEVVLEHPEIVLWRQGIVVGVQSEQTSFSSGTVRVTKATLIGAGNPLDLDARLTPSGFSIKAKGHGVDLQKVAYVFGRQKRTEGMLDLDADLEASKGGLRGHIELEIDRAEIEEVGKGQLRVELELERNRLKGMLNGEFEPGRIDVRTDGVRLTGSPLEGRSWRGATGNVDFDIDVDLARIKGALPPRAVPFDAMAGALKAKGMLEWAGLGQMPELQLSAETKGLELSQKGDEQPRFDGKIVEAPPLWRIDGVDLQVETTVKGNEGSTDFKGRIFDQRGAIAELAFDTKVPYRQLFSNAKGVLSRLDQLPLHAKLTIPKRKLSEFPPLLRAKGIEGEVELELNAKQEQGVPSFELVSRVKQLKFQDSKDAIPISAELKAKYDNDHGNVDLNVAVGQEPALEAKSEVEGKLGDLLRNGLGAFQWKTSTRVKATQFPLHAIPVIAERQVKGTLTGEVTLDAASGQSPLLQAAFELERLRISNVAYGSSRAQLALDREALSSSVRLVQADGGYLEATAKLTVAPKAEPPGSFMSFDSAEVSLKSERFRASALQPFLRGAVAELDGQIDANASLKLSEKESAMKGSVSFDKGRFQLESVGEEFQNAKARVRFDPNGKIVVENASAQGSSGKVSAEAWAKLDGMRFVEAHAGVKIPKGDPLPVVIEGEPLAEAWGTVNVNVRADKNDAMEITVDVPSAGIRLPEKSSHDLQALGRPETIRVGVQRSSKEFVVLSTSDAGEKPTGEPEVTRIKLKLRNVEVRRSTTLRSVLEGELNIESAGETSIRGRITLRSGLLEVQGKRFEIERGLITFVGDSSNPEVIVTAGWTAPEGTRVYADFIGPLKTGKVTLRAEPAHSQSEILSLILFGTTDGQAVPVNSSQNSSDSGGGVASGAVGIGGSIATQGLNRALDDLTGLDITTRIDTTDSSNPRPEVELQIAQDISLSIAHVLGMSSAETNLDRNFLILDWRFTRNWSLETTFGDKGSTIVDAVWQRRY